MFFKFILGLLLAIAVGVLGGSTLGEGFFGFKTTAAATKVVEDIRDIGVAMQTFKAADDQVRTAIDVADIDNGGVADDWTTADVIGQIGAAGAGYLEAGAENTTAGTVGFLVAGSAIYATVDSDGDGLSTDLCNELNDLFGNDDVAFGTEAAPVVPVYADEAAMFTALPGLVNGAASEGACVDLGGVETLVYYVQQN